MDIKPQLKALLERHTGRGTAITRRELKRILDYNDDRQLRLLIRELIAEGLPVISTSVSPPGYYVAGTYQELQEGRATIKSYLVEEALRMRDLKVYGSRYLAGEAQGKLL